MVDNSQATRIRTPAFSMYYIPQDREKVNNKKRTTQKLVLSNIMGTYLLFGFHKYSTLSWHFNVHPSSLRTDCNHLHLDCKCINIVIPDLSHDSYQCVISMHISCTLKSLKHKNNLQYENFESLLSGGYIECK
jgi:hypothetical protein